MLLIKSPKATRVISVLDSSVVVEKGTLLMRLSDLEEEVLLSKIRRQVEENEAKLIEVQSEHSDRRIYKELESISQFFAQALRNNQRIEDICQSEYEQGTEMLTNVLLARKKAISSNIKWLQAEAERKIHYQNVQDSVAVFKIVKQLLLEEISIVEKYVSRLSIKAPYRGTFHCKVEIGSPVKLGHVLGEFQ